MVLEATSGASETGCLASYLSKSLTDIEATLVGNLKMSVSFLATNIQTRL